MAQTAHHGSYAFPAGEWHQFSEENCTFTAYTAMEVIGAASQPATAIQGIRYEVGEGEKASTDMLSEFPGVTGTVRLWAISRHTPGAMFLSRAAVA